MSEPETQPETDPAEMDDPTTVEPTAPRKLPEGGIAMYGINVGSERNIKLPAKYVDDFGLRACRLIVYAKYAEEEEWSMLLAGLRAYPDGSATIPSDYAEGYGVEEGDTLDMRVVERIYV